MEEEIAEDYNAQYDTVEPEGEDNQEGSSIEALLAETAAEYSLAEVGDEESGAEESTPELTVEPTAEPVEDNTSDAVDAVIEDAPISSVDEAAVTEVVNEILDDGNVS